MTVGASLIAVPVKLLLPVIAGAVPSEILVVTVKLELKLLAGVNISPANKVFTSAMAPEAIHIPVLAT